MSSPISAAEPANSSVTIPTSDWSLCKQYKATLEQRVQDLTQCAQDGIAVRTAKDQCVGELKARQADNAFCQSDLIAEKARTAVLEEKRDSAKGWLFWASGGALAASGGALLVEVLAGDRPETEKAIALGSVAALSSALLVFNF